MLDENEIYEGLGLEVPGTEGGGAAAAPGTEDGQGTGAETATPAGDRPSVEAEKGGAAGTPSLTGGAGDAEAGQGTGANPSAPAGHLPYEGEVKVGDSQVGTEIDRAYAEAFAGRKDPYTGQAITSKAGYDAYMLRLKEEEQRTAMERLRASGIGPEVLNGIIGNHPAVREAQAVAEQARQARREAEEVKAREWYASEMREIAALDPEVKSMEDLAGRDPEGYRAMLDMVGRGMSLSGAYKARYFDTLVQRRTAAAQQAARNQAAGKAHLAPSAGQGKGGVEVPQSVKDLCADMGLDLSDAEMGKFYGEYAKSQG